MAYRSTQELQGRTCTDEVAIRGTLPRIISHQPCSHAIGGLTKEDKRTERLLASYSFHLLIPSSCTLEATAAVMSIAVGLPAGFSKGHRLLPCNPPLRDYYTQHISSLHYCASPLVVLAKIRLGEFPGSKDLLNSHVLTKKW